MSKNNTVIVWLPQTSIQNTVHMNTNMVDETDNSTSVTSDNLCESVDDNQQNAAEEIVIPISIEEDDLEMDGNQMLERVKLLQRVASQSDDDTVHMNTNMVDETDNSTSVISDNLCESVNDNQQNSTEEIVTTTSIEEDDLEMDGNKMLEQMKLLQRLVSQSDDEEVKEMFKDISLKLAIVEARINVATVNSEDVPNEDSTEEERCMRIRKEALSIAEEYNDALENEVYERFEVTPVAEVEVIDGDHETCSERLDDNVDYENIETNCENTNTSSLNTHIINTQHSYSSTEAQFNSDLLSKYKEILNMKENEDISDDDSESEKEMSDENTAEILGKESEEIKTSTSPDLYLETISPINTLSNTLSFVYLEDTNEVIIYNDVNENIQHGSRKSSNSEEKVNPIYENIFVTEENWDQHSNDQHQDSDEASVNFEKALEVIGANSDYKTPRAVISENIEANSSKEGWNRLDRYDFSRIQIRKTNQYQKRDKSEKLHIYENINQKRPPYERPLSYVASYEIKDKVFDITKFGKEQPVNITLNNSKQDISVGALRGSPDGMENDEEVLKLESKKPSRVENIINELIATEENYILSLEYLIKEYVTYLTGPKISKKLEKESSLFMSIVSICEDSKRFLIEMQQNRSEYDKIGRIFLKHKKEKELKDKLGLSSRLTNPIQRISKYELLLKELSIHLKQEKYLATDTLEALIFIQHIASTCDSLVLLESIKDRVTFTLEETGDFVMNDVFHTIKPKREAIIVHLFKKIAIFTGQDPKNAHLFKYRDHVKLKQIRTQKCDDKLQFKIIYPISDTSGFEYHFEASDESKMNIFLDAINMLKSDSLDMNDIKAFKRFSSTRIPKNKGEEKHRVSRKFNSFN